MEQKADGKKIATIFFNFFDQFKHLPKKYPCEPLATIVKHT
jgi:hypothetical protein